MSGSSPPNGPTSLHHWGQRSAASLPIAAALFLGCQPETAAQSADWVLRGGPVYTVDAERSVARAVAIADGVIAAVGSVEEIERYVGEETRVIELEGRMVLPGLHDLHIHPISGAMETLFTCQFPTTAGRARSRRRWHSVPKTNLATAGSQVVVGAARSSRTPTLTSHCSTR